MAGHINRFLRLSRKASGLQRRGALLSLILGLFITSSVRLFYSPFRKESGIEVGFPKELHLFQNISDEDSCTSWWEPAASLMRSRTVPDETLTTSEEIQENPEMKNGKPHRNLWSRQDGPHYGTQHLPYNFSIQSKNNHPSRGILTKLKSKKTFS